LHAARLGRKLTGARFVKNTARAIAVVVSLIIMAFAPIMLSTPVQAQTASLKDQVVGHWQLVSVTINGIAPYGTNPQGSMFIDAGGHFAVIVVSSGNARNVSYFGTYTINNADGTMTMHIEANAEGGGFNAAGRDMSRHIALNGDELTLQSETPSGMPGRVVMTWKKAN
jgi:hypothetical protein